MPESTEYDPTDRGTLRPNAKPLIKRGTEFKPMILPDFDYEIELPEDTSPDDPITLFTMYYTLEMIDIIVRNTNSYIPEPEDSECPNTHTNSWYPTCRREIYVYFAIRIYMTLYISNEISDYWATKEFTPIHSISKEMSRNRYQELHLRVRLASTGASNPFDKVICCTFTSNRILLILVY